MFPSPAGAPQRQPFPALPGKIDWDAPDQEPTAVSLPAQITIPAQFNGPPTTGNGGYCAGKIGALIDGPAMVSLRSPPPLDTPLEIRHIDERLEAWHDDTLVMFAAAATPRLTAPAPPALAAARHGPETYPNADTHINPACFVCGPNRTPGDGLCLFAGKVDGYDGVADVWMPEPVFADADGMMPPEIIWAALDCPSYFAIPEADAYALLASITVQIQSRPKAGEAVIVTGWHDRSEGRKHFSGTALHTPDGELLAQSDALWIELKPSST